MTATPLKINEIIIYPHPGQKASISFAHLKEKRHIRKAEHFVFVLLRKDYIMVEVKLFSGTQSQYLSEKIADFYGSNLGNITLQRFSDGEMQPIINESVRGAYVFLIQSTFAPGDNLLELAERFGKDRMRRGEGAPRQEFVRAGRCRIEAIRRLTRGFASKPCPDAFVFTSPA